MSSAYVNSNRKYAMEKIYDAPANYDDIINYVQSADFDKLNSNSEKLVVFFYSFNTYKCIVVYLQN